MMNNKVWEFIISPNNRKPIVRSFCSFIRNLVQWNITMPLLLFNSLHNRFFLWKLFLRNLGKEEIKTWFAMIMLHWWRWKLGYLITLKGKAFFETSVFWEWKYIGSVVIHFSMENCKPIKISYKGNHTQWGIMFERLRKKGILNGIGICIIFLLYYQP